MDRPYAPPASGTCAKLPYFGPPLPYFPHAVSVAVAPGGLEGPFLEMGEPVTDPVERPGGPRDPSRLLERAPEYGLEFLVPDAGR